MKRQVHIPVLQTCLREKYKKTPKCLAVDEKNVVIYLIYKNSINSENTFTTGYR
jgi:hypothetical protein